MPQRTHGTRADGARSRAAILDAATRLASVTGLEGLSIGALADEVGMSKSGLYAHFASKEDLQLATVGAAREVFIAEVVVPALAVESPRDRLQALCDGFLDYVEQRVFPGGCFFVSAAAEFGSRAGPVHDEVAAVQREWSDFVHAVASEAHDAGELAADPDQVAFELTSLLAGANLTYVLHDDPDLIRRARGAIREVLRPA
jgi:AcrR family transcriptional regulator